MLHLINEKEKDWLISNYHIATWEEIFKNLPNRTKTQIYDLAKYYKCVNKGYVNISHRVGNVRPLLEDTNEAIYWAGFLLADGSITKKHELALTLSEKDFQHIDKFSKFIGGTKVIDYRNQYSKKYGYKYKRTTVKDVCLLPLFEQKYDFRPKKTYNPPNIDILDKTINEKDKFLSFFVGFIDGDGCIVKSKKNNNVYMCLENNESYEHLHYYFIEKLKSYYPFVKTKKVQKIPKKKTCKITFVNISFLKLLKADIKKLNIPALDRKWDKIDI